MVRHVMVVMEVMMVLMVVVIMVGVEGVATPLRAPVTGYVGVSSDRQTVLVDLSKPPPQPKSPSIPLPHSHTPSTNLPRSKPPSTLLPRPSTPSNMPLPSQPPANTSTPPASPGVSEGPGKVQSPQTARLRGGRYPLQRLRQQRRDGKGEWRRRGAGAVMGDRRMRPSGGRKGSTTSGRRRYLAGARRRVGQGKDPLQHLQHRFAVPHAPPTGKRDDFLSRWHDTYSGSHQRPLAAPAAAGTTAVLVPSSTGPTFTQPPTPPTPASVPPAAAASVHDMTSRHFNAANTTTSNTTTTNNNSSTTKPHVIRAGGQRPPSLSLVSSTHRPVPTSTPPQLAAPQTPPRGTDILGSVQSIVRAASGDEHRLAATKTVGNASPPPLDVFAGVPAAAGFVPSARLEPVLQSVPRLASPPPTPTLAPRNELRPSSAAPAALQPQGLTTGHYLVAVGRPVPPEVRDGGLVLPGDGDVVVGRPAAHIQAPQHASPHTPPTRPAGHAPDPGDAHMDDHSRVTTHGPIHSPTHSTTHTPAHALSFTSLHRADYTSGSDPALSPAPAPSPAHVLTQLPGPQQVVLGSVAPWTPEEVRPLLAFIRRKYGEAVTHVPPSVTSLQALISSGRVPEVFHGPKVLDGLKTTTAAATPLYRPMTLRRRQGEAWRGEVAVRKSQEALGVSSGGRFVALSSLALLMAFCGYLIFASSPEKVTQPRGATGVLVTAVEEAKKGLNLLLQDLDEYEDHLRNMEEKEKEEEKNGNEILPQKTKNEEKKEEGQKGGLIKDIPSILTKIWDVVVPPEVRGPNSVFSYFSSGLGFANSSRTSKRLTVFLKPYQPSLPSLSDLKENGIKFMNQVTENGAELLIKSVRDKGFDLIQVNGSESTDNGTSVLTRDRVSSVIHSFLDSLNVQPVTDFVSRLVEPFEPTSGLTSQGNETEKVNQGTKNELNQEPEDITTTMNLNQDQENKKNNDLEKEDKNMKENKEEEEDMKDEEEMKENNNNEKEKEENEDKEENKKDKKDEEKEEKEVNKDDKEMSEENKDEEKMLEEVRKQRKEEEEEEQSDILESEYQEIIEWIEQIENQEFKNRNEDEEVFDEEEKEKMTNTEERNSNTWTKKEERKEGKEEKEDKINQTNEERELKEILNNLLHVGNLPLSGSSSFPSSSSSYFSSFPSRVVAYVDNIPFSQVTQELQET
ncbi:uncharacterized protein LOC126983723 [Eriocheir sinensis]|uniref:uncharacterized protein LOC126983723 n=1 Tax=Eriocheir sinensis TaxID=95602 RepID=UPI0021C5F10A|nr:uncharacterized protein LOC126983723 [Eriocheir sinensis]